MLFHYFLEMMRWHCPQDTGLEIRGLAVWGRAGYFSVTEASHNIEFVRMDGEETLWNLKARSQTFQAGSFNSCTRAPAQVNHNNMW